MRNQLIWREYNKKLKLINYYNKKYYNENISEITDSEYDLLKQEINLRKKPGENESPPSLVFDEKIEIPNTYIKKEQIRINYYYQISKASKEQEVDLIKKKPNRRFWCLTKRNGVLVKLCQGKNFVHRYISKKNTGF